MKLQSLIKVYDMRIVTRQDFDGIVCAALLRDGENIKNPVHWVEPWVIQKGLAEIRKGDILANLPFHENCSLWFDHHYSNRIDRPFKGDFRIVPSAARIVYDYYKSRFTRDYAELVDNADRIDAAQLSVEEVLHPQNFPYILLSMTIKMRDTSDEEYCNMLVDLLGKRTINEVIDDPRVRERRDLVIKLNQEYKRVLKENTRVIDKVAVTDLRHFDKAPVGNRFLVYSLFPGAVVNVKIRHSDQDRNKVVVSIGHSIFNRACNVNAGLLLSHYEGGGHRCAASCNFHKRNSDRYIPEILDVLAKNERNTQNDPSESELVMKTDHGRPPFQNEGCVARAVE